MLKTKIARVTLPLFLILLVIFITLQFVSYFASAHGFTLTETVTTALSYLILVPLLVFGALVFWRNRGNLDLVSIFLVLVVLIFIPQVVAFLKHFEIFLPIPSKHINHVIVDLRPILVAIGAIVGVVYVYQHRGEIDKSYVAPVEQQAQEKPKTKRWKYALLLLLVLLIGLWLSMYRLGDFDFREDEYQVIGAAAGYHYTGELYVWNWLEDTQGERYYDRAWPHTIMVAQAYDFFGISELSSRLVSVIWYLFFILLSYFIGSRALNKKFGILFAVVVAIFPMYLYWARYTRMYILFIPTFFIASYFIYKGLFEGKTKQQLKLLAGLRINYPYLILGGIFSILAIFFIGVP